MSANSVNFGVSSDVVETPADLPNPARRRRGAIAFTRTPIGIYALVIPPGGVATWVLEALGPSSPVGRSVLTLDPTGVAGPGVYTTWAALWAAYVLTTGAVSIWVLGQATVPAGTYAFRSGTVFYGIISPVQYDLELSNGAVFQDVQHLVSSRCEASAPAPRSRSQRTGRGCCSTTAAT